VEIKCQLDATGVFYCRSYCLLNMFRAPLWKPLLHLVGILFPHINDDARSISHQTRLIIASYLGETPPTPQISGSQEKGWLHIGWSWADSKQHSAEWLQVSSENFALARVSTTTQLAMQLRNQIATCSDKKKLYNSNYVTMHLRLQNYRTVLFDKCKVHR